MKYELSKKGIPCLWEKGGGYTNKGKATLIADGKFLPKKPIYVRRSGMLACAEHALIPVRKGDVIIEIFQHRGDYRIEIFQIYGFNEKDQTLNLQIVNIFDRGEWDLDIENENLKAFIKAAKSKSRAYHCRSAYYIKEGE